MLRVFAALAALALLGTAAQADDWNRTYPVRGRATVSIRTNDGHVHVTEGAGKEVQVRVHTVGWHIGGQVQVDGRQSGDRIDVEARVPNWHMGLTITFNETRRLEIEVVTPRQSDLVIRTGDGGVEIERITGRVEVETGDGHIRCAELKGDVRVHTGDGGVEVRALDGTLAAFSGDGSVRVSGRFDGLELETGDGRVVAEALQGSKIGEGWSIATGDGPVTLRLAGPIAADVDARTNDGSISTDFPISVSGSWGRRRLHGALNGGGPPIRLRTGDGSIRLEKI